MELKSGYKPTDVGIIPENWNVRPISSFAEVSGRVGWKGYTKKDLVPYGPYAIGAKHIDRHNRIDLSDPTFLSIQKYIESPEIMVRTGDILIVQRGTIGKLVLIDRNIGDATINPSMVIIRARKVIPAFIAFFLLSSPGQKQILADTSSTGVPMISQKQIENFLIPLPSIIAEQEAIAKALSDADALIESIEQLVAKKCQIKQGAMQELLTGKKRLPGFDGEWEKRRLGEIGGFHKGSGVARGESLSGNLPCIRYGEIYTRHNDYIRIFHSWISRNVAANAMRLKKGDVLFAGSGETKEEIGKCVAFIDDIEAYAGGDIVILRPEEMDSLFLGYYFNSAPIVRQKASRGQGDAVVHIGAAALADIEGIFPSKAEQTAIATILHDIDAEVVALESKLSKSRHIKQGMMQELLTGRIRLK